MFHEKHFIEYFSLAIMKKIAFSILNIIVTVIRVFPTIKIICVDCIFSLSKSILVVI